MPDSVIHTFAAVLGVEKAEDDGMEVEVDGAKGKTTGFDDVRKKVKEVVREGYSASQLLSQVSFDSRTHGKARGELGLQLHDYIIEHPTLTARQKSHSALALAEADKALCDGADEELQILEVALRVHKAVSL